MSLFIDCSLYHLKKGRTNNAEKYIDTQTRSKILPAYAEHPFAFIRLRRLFKPRLSTQWHTASYTYKGRIQYHLYSRPRVTDVTAFTKTLILIYSFCAFCPPFGRAKGAKTVKKSSWPPQVASLNRAGRLMRSSERWIYSLDPQPSISYSERKWGHLVVPLDKF